MIHEILTIPKRLQFVGKRLHLKIIDGLVEMPTILMVPTRIVYSYYNSSALTIGGRL